MFSLQLPNLNIEPGQSKSVNINPVWMQIRWARRNCTLPTSKPERQTAEVSKLPQYARVTGPNSVITYVHAGVDVVADLDVDLQCFADAQAGRQMELGLERTEHLDGDRCGETQPAAAGHRQRPQGPFAGLLGRRNRQARRRYFRTETES